MHIHSILIEAIRKLFSTWTNLKIIHEQKLPEYSILILRDISGGEYLITCNKISLRELTEEKKAVLEAEMILKKESENGK